jgi:hypothetical protein
MSEPPFYLQWETLGNEGAEDDFVIQRARVFGGWLVCTVVRTGAPALAFVPDFEGRWDGEDFGEYDYEYEDDEEESQEGEEPEDKK